MSESWIKLFRNVTDWRYYDDDFMFRFFITLILDANVYEKEWHGVTIKRGQLVTSLPNLAMEFKKSVKQIRLALHKLEGKEIEINTTNRYTVISIKNYEAYQNCDCSQSEKGTQRARQNDSLNNSYFDTYANNNSDEETEEGRQRADKGQTKGRQRALTKEYKKEIKKEEEISTNVDKEKKLSADAEIFLDEKNSGNNLAPVAQEEKKEKNSARKERTQFVPPTLEEVKDYEAQKGYTFSAEKFWGYYESNGWRVGKNPMKSWHGACVTWQGKQNEEQINLNNNGINSQRPESRFERREREEREYLEKMERLSRSFIEHPDTETKLNFGDENT